MIFKKGKSVDCEYFKVFVLIKKKEVPNIDETIIRLGYIINKKIGSSVIRNKIKRRLKEIIRNYKKNVIKNDGFDIDILIIVKKEILLLNYDLLGVLLCKYIESIIENFKKSDLK